MPLLYAKVEKSIQNMRDKVIDACGLSKKGKYPVLLLADNGKRLFRVSQKKRKSVALNAVLCLGE